MFSAQQMFLRITLCRLLQYLAGGLSLAAMCLVVSAFGVPMVFIGTFQGKINIVLVALGMFALIAAAAVIISLIVRLILYLFMDVPNNLVCDNDQKCEACRHCQIVEIISTGIPGTTQECHSVEYYNGKQSKFFSGITSIVHAIGVTWVITLWYLTYIALVYYTEVYARLIPVP